MKFGVFAPKHTRQRYKLINENGIQNLKTQVLDRFAFVDQLFERINADL